jgi:hypothetical protein
VAAPSYDWYPEYQEDMKTDPELKEIYDYFRGFFNAQQGDAGLAPYYPGGERYEALRKRWVIDKKKCEESFINFMENSIICHIRRISKDYTLGDRGVIWCAKYTQEYMTKTLGWFDSEYYLADHANIFSFSRSALKNQYLSRPKQPEPDLAPVSESFRRFLFTSARGSPSVTNGAPAPTERRPSGGATTLAAPAPEVNEGLWVGFMTKLAILLSPCATVGLKKQLGDNSAKIFDERLNGIKLSFAQSYSRSLGGSIPVEMVLKALDSVVGEILAMDGRKTTIVMRDVLDDPESTTKPYLDKFNQSLADVLRLPSSPKAFLR